MPNQRDTCCVPGCEQPMDLHKFPHPVKDSERFRTWMMSIGGDIIGMTDDYVYKNRRVCHNHFEDYYKCRNNRISNIAVPTLRMRGMINTTSSSSSRQPFQEILNIQPGPSQVIQMIPTGQSADIIMDDYSKIMPPDVQGPAVKTLECHKLLMEKIPSLVQTHAKETSTCNKEPVEKMDVTDTPKLKMKRVIKYKKILKDEKILLNKITVLKMKLNKCRNTNKKQQKSLQMAKKLVTNSAFIKASENLTSSGKLLTLLQFRESKKKKKGRRFTLKEKILALTILKQSPKAYRFLRKIFVLPATQTLVKLVNRAIIKPGVHQRVFDQLKTKAEKMKQEEKICVLLFDEISIQASLSYSERQDAVIGFTTDGQNNKKVFANHALVFMIRGLFKNYKQPVAYTFCSGATKATELKAYIKEIIKKMQSAGFIVIATVCDQGANNQKTIKSLVEETRADKLRKGEVLKNNIFKVDGQEVIPIYDPPHLLKGIRNNLLIKDLVYVQDGKTCVAKWKHIELLYAENPGYKGIRLMPKLTENHCDPKKIGKMRVKFASQLFSETVSCNMGYLADKGIIPEECKETADILLLFDRLFDSLNGSYHKKNKTGKPFLMAVKPNSAHIELWKKSKPILSTMKFIKKNGKVDSVPTLKNWIWTIEGVENLVKKLHEEHNITSLWARHLNQDPVENFFGAIRSQGCRNNNPNPAAFQLAYTTLMINNLTSIHAAGSNCEDDLCDALQAYIMTESTESTVSPVHELDIQHILLKTTPIEDKRKDPKIMAPLTYVSGYFLRQCKKRIIYKKCNLCEQLLANKNKDCEYIKYREFAQRGWLCYPSDELIRVISEIQDICYVTINDKIDKPFIKEYIKMVILTIIDFKSIACGVHLQNVIEFLLNSVVNFFLYNYCKDTNKILCGKRKIDDCCDEIQKSAQELYNRSLKIKKK